MSTVAPILDPTFTVNATICSILPREDGQDHTVFLRTHGAYVVHHPHGGDRFDGEHVLVEDVIRDSAGHVLSRKPKSIEKWVGSHNVALTYLTHKVDYADVGEYDPAKVKRTGVDPRKQYHFDAKQIADDICKQHNENAAGDRSFFGLFVCKGTEPTEQELEAAHKRLSDYFMQSVAAADAQWSDNPVHSLISGVAKRAGRWLKLNPEDHGWMSSFRVMADCPACGTRIRPGVAICKACGAILDQEKYKKFFPADAKHRSPGRPRKEPVTV